MNIIPKLQSGGGFPFTIYRPIATQQYSSKTSNDTRESTTIKDSYKEKDSESDKGKLTEKDLFNMIKDIDGLPNEMKYIISDLKKTMDIQRISGIDTGQLSNMYLNSLYKMKVANDNKAKFDEAVKDAKQNGSLGEVAITLDGSLLSTDEKGNIQAVSLGEYQSDPDKYRLITNSQLAWLRKYDRKMAFSSSDSAFEILDNGMGYESFQALLDKAKTTLGNNKYEEHGIIDKRALAGLRALQGKSDAEKLEIIKKVEGDTLEYTSSQDSNVENVKAYINYLTAALPKRAKVWAAIKTGKSENEATALLVGQYLASNIKSDSSLTFDFDSKSKKDGSKGSGSSDDFDKLEYNTPEKFLEGLGVSRIYVLNPGTSRAVQVLANEMPLTNAEGKPIGTNATLQDAVSGEYNGILDTNHATMGGHTVDSSKFGSIILKDGKISSIDYPCTVKNNGEIIPNTSPKIIKAKQDAEQLLRTMGVDVRKPEHIKKYWEAINAAYKKFGLEEAYNKEGKPIGSWRRFGVINVTASDKALGMDDMDDNPLLKEVTDDSVIDNLIQITKDEDFSKKGFFNSITGGYNRFYEGTLWIPLDINYHAAGLSTKTTVAQARAMEERQQARDARANWNTPPSI